MLYIKNIFLKIKNIILVYLKKLKNYYKTIKKTQQKKSAHI